MAWALLTFTCTSQLAAQTSFPSGTAGSYTALLDRDLWYNGNFGGLLKITVTTTGSYSGTVTRGRHQSAFRGQLQMADESVTPTGTFTVPRAKPYSPLEVKFSLPVGAAQITGTLKEPGGPPLQLSGHRHGFSASQPATSFIGTWNVTSEHSREWYLTSTPQWPYGDLNFPQGASWYIQRVNAAGTVTWAGMMADGTPLTYSTGLSQNGTSVMHVRLYGSKGSIQGRQNYNVTSSSVTGSCDWIKTAVSSGRAFVRGFPLHRLEFIGGRYSPPTKGQMLFGITPDPGNVGLAIVDFSPVYHGLTYTIWTDNKVFVPTRRSPENLERVSMSLDINTGIIRGKVSAFGYTSYMPSLARPGAFSALISPNSITSQFRGHALVPTNKSPLAPIQSFMFESF